MNEKIRRAQIDDAAGIARVHVDSWRTAYRRLIPDETLDNLSISRREKYWQGVLQARAEILFVAEVDGEVVGFAGGGPERYGIIRERGQLPFDGELYAIYLLESASGQGIGSRLFRAFAERLFEAGFHRLLVWVLSDNTVARRFYEARGGFLETERMISIADVELPEVAYGWDLPLP